jgi:anti-sigma factor RsiW
MACKRIDDVVTPFVDGELSDADRRNVEDHMRVCPPCHSRVLAERTVRDLVRARRPALNACRAPALLHTACAAISKRDGHAALTPAVVPSRAFAGMPRATHLAPYALAASLAFVVGGAFVYQATDKSARVMAAELTADHMKCFALNGVLGTHQGAGAVESSMMSGFGWRMHMPAEPSRADLELIGSRPCVYCEVKVAHIMYRHQGRPVSLFMLPNSARTKQLVEVLGHEAAIWCAGNRTFVLIAREPRQDVERLASFVQASLPE